MPPVSFLHSRLFRILSSPAHGLVGHNATFFILYFLLQSYVTSHLVDKTLAAPAFGVGVTYGSAHIRPFNVLVKPPITNSLTVLQIQSFQPSLSKRRIWNNIPRPRKA